MDFFRVFEEIDVDFSGEITKDELVAYAKKKHFKSTMVDKWLELFDIDNSGTISLEEFCEVLGLQPPKVYFSKVMANRESNSDVIVPKMVSTQSRVPGGVAQEGKHKQNVSGSGARGLSQSTIIKENKAEEITKVVVASDTPKKEDQTQTITQVVVTSQSPSSSSIVTTTEQVTKVMSFQTSVTPTTSFPQKEGKSEVITNVMLVQSTVDPISSPKKEEKIETITTRVSKQLSQAPILSKKIETTTTVDQITKVLTSESQVDFTPSTKIQQTEQTTKVESKESIAIEGKTKNIVSSVSSLTTSASQKEEKPVQMTKIDLKQSSGTSTAAVLKEKTEQQDTKDFPLKETKTEEITKVSNTTLASTSPITTIKAVSLESPQYLTSPKQQGDATGQERVVRTYENRKGPIKQEEVQKSVETLTEQDSKVVTTLLKEEKNEKISSGPTITSTSEKTTKVQQPTEDSILVTLQKTEITKQVPLQSIAAPQKKEEEKTVKFPKIQSNSTSVIGEALKEQNIGITGAAVNSLQNGNKIKQETTVNVTESFVVSSSLLPNQMQSTIDQNLKTKRELKVEKKSATKQERIEKSKGPKVTILSVDPEMHKSAIDFIIRVGIRLACGADAAAAASSSPSLNKMARQFKHCLDDHEDVYWHVIVSQEAVDGALDHEPEGFIHFTVNKYYFLLWRTPSMENDSNDEDFFL